MKGKRLLKALGQVDADYIEEASPTQQAKRPGWLKWGAIAACLVLVCAAIAHFSPANQDEDKQGVADAAPMVYVNDTLYIQSSNQKGYPEQEDGFVYLGKILSDVTNYQGDGADGIPKENFQANDPIIGCEVYQYGENIVVKINSSYWLYMKYGEPEITWDDLTEQEKADLDPTYKDNRLLWLSEQKAEGQGPLFEPCPSALF